MAIKFAFLTPDYGDNTDKFIDHHFSCLLHSEALRCIQDMKYQVMDAYCEHGVHFERDPRFFKINPAEENNVVFEKLAYSGAFLFTLEEEHDNTFEEFKFFVFFLWIPSNSSDIFAFYDVKCA